MSTDANLRAESNCANAALICFADVAYAELLRIAELFDDTP